MINDLETPTPKWGQSCPHFGVGYGVPCPHFGDALSQLWGRFGAFLPEHRPHFGDILNYHIHSKSVCLPSAEQLDRLVAIISREGGQAAWLLLSACLRMVPMPLKSFGGGVAVWGYAFALCSISERHSLDAFSMFHRLFYPLRLAMTSQKCSSPPSSLILAALLMRCLLVHLLKVQSALSLLLSRLFVRPSKFSIDSADCFT